MREQGLSSLRRYYLTGRKHMAVLAWLALALLFAVAAVACAGGSADTRFPAAVAPVAGLFEQKLPLAGGGAVDFRMFRGRVVVADLFYTWSQHSMVAVAGYSVLAKKFQQRGVAWVGIALDELGDTIVAPFASGMNASYPITLADQAIREGRSCFGPVDVSPKLMLFDRAGQPVQIFLGLVSMAEIERAVSRLAD